VPNHYARTGMERYAEVLKESVSRCWKCACCKVRCLKTCSPHDVHKTAEPLSVQVVVVMYEE
jgi:heterodisulfide reductase subunit C